jgi:hypothetical protein
MHLNDMAFFLMTRLIDWLGFSFALGSILRAHFLRISMFSAALSFRMQEPSSLNAGSSRQ